MSLWKDNDFGRIEAIEEDTKLIVIDSTVYRLKLQYNQCLLSSKKSLDVLLTGEDSQGIRLV